MINDIHLSNSSNPPFVHSVFTEDYKIVGYVEANIVTFSIILYSNATKYTGAQLSAIISTFC